MRPVHILILLLVLIIIFGASKLPDIARNIGKSAKVLKSELSDLSEDSSNKQVAAEPQNPQIPAAPPASSPGAASPTSSKTTNQQTAIAHPPETT
ncbi:Sec-independent protein translocase subunit TatA [Varibaculum sp.]|uniref:Sec-independent protein translocase subunit TatA n=1 Tax=Varibaculum sp. TaxID=1895474 RepID=UPI0025F93C79|nr:Sec-independent protein translocase subunit TatA [Varibaculum sp.]